MSREPWVASSAFCDAPWHHPSKMPSERVGTLPGLPTPLVLLSPASQIRKALVVLQVLNPFSSPWKPAFFFLLFCSFLNKIRVLHAQPAATTRSQVFSGTLGGFFRLPSTVPCSYPRERWNRLCDRSWSLKLLSFCSKSVVSFNLTEIRCSPCEHLAVMISVNFRLPNPRTAPRAVSHCFHVPCLQKYARGFSFVSFLF